ncbi:hypothetical protein IGB42_02268 [Andreprevotia sp. IGB-42]|uniref:hypothetical protein n=1 Tax=Andreprevotia sp. IGB-42 TaxID=2497473 RepID=UPI00135BCD32|nr:hypothetical protein [Andreprevotia sp. IGB-42]KAF0813339.1 hypothetical protein IGB42_02268 [Andreprevotia sp. IGB-42]
MNSNNTLNHLDLDRLWNDDDMGGRQRIQRRVSNRYERDSAPDTSNRRRRDAVARRSDKHGLQRAS